MIENYLTEISLLIATALACGMLFEWFGQPAILGYILAGGILGPSGIALVDDKSYLPILAELGVQMLLYIVGMELSLAQFQKVWKVAGSTAILQILGTMLVIKTIGVFLHWTNGYVIILSVAIALSSTAVAIQLLKRIDQLNAPAGRFTIGVLIAQDLLVIPIILILRQYNEGFFQIGTILKFVAAIAILGFLVRFLGRGKPLHLPFLRTLVKNTELTALGGVFFCFGCAALAGLIGFSTAYGAFLGGLIVGNTAQKETLIKMIQPIQSILLAAFFVSVGLLLDVSFIWQNFIKLTCLMLVLFVCKTVLNMVVLRVLGQTWKLSFLSGIVLSQMGEFGFLVASIGFEERLIDSHGKQLILTLVVLSLIASPFWLKSIKKIRNTKFASEELTEILNKVYDQDFTIVCRIKALCIGMRRYFISRKTSREHVAPIIVEPTKQSELTNHDSDLRS